MAKPVRFGHLQRATIPGSENFVPLISGPPKDVVFGMAHDFAEVAMEIYRLQELDGPAQEQTIEKLKTDGSPTTLAELVDLAAATVIAQKLGWYRSNQFFGGLLGFCVLSGMPRADAAYLIRLIKTKAR